MIIENKHTGVIKSRRDDILILPLRGFAVGGDCIYYNNNIPSGLKPMVK